MNKVSFSPQILKALRTIPAYFLLYAGPCVKRFAHITSFNSHFTGKDTSSETFYNLPKVTELTNSDGIQKPVLLTTTSGQVIIPMSSAGPSQLDQAKNGSKKMFLCLFILSEFRKVRYKVRLCKLATDTSESIALALIKKKRICFLLLISV